MTREIKEVNENYFCGHLFPYIGFYLIFSGSFSQFLYRVCRLYKRKHYLSDGDRVVNQQLHWRAVFHFDTFLRVSFFIQILKDWTKSAAELCYAVLPESFQYDKYTPSMSSCFDKPTGVSRKLTARLPFFSSKTASAFQQCVLTQAKRVRPVTSGECYLQATAVGALDVKTNVRDYDTITW